MLRWNPPTSAFAMGAAETHAIAARTTAAKRALNERMSSSLASAGGRAAATLNPSAAASLSEPSHVVKHPRETAGAYESETKFVKSFSSHLPAECAPPGVLDPQRLMTHTCARNPAV